MNTKLWPIHPLTGSNKHGNSAIDKQVSDLVKLTQAWNFRSGSTLWSMKTIYYRNLTWQRKACNGDTQRALQKSLSDLEPKGIRKYNCKHVNMAKT